MYTSSVEASNPTGELESHLDQMSSKHKIAFDLSKPLGKTRDRKRDPILG